MDAFIKTINVLNVDKEKSTLSIDKLVTDHSNVQNKGFIISDADEELLILIEFQNILSLQSIKVYALLHDEVVDDELDTSAPKQVDIYKLSNLNIDFNDFDDRKCDKSIECKANKLETGQVIKLKNLPKFNKIKFLAIYIRSNQNETETTYFNCITMKIKNKVSNLWVDTKDTKTQKQFDRYLNDINDAESKPNVIQKSSHYLLHK
eukprot:375849_1